MSYVLHLAIGIAFWTAVFWVTSWGARLVRRHRNRGCCCDVPRCWRRASRRVAIAVIETENGGSFTVHGIDADMPIRLACAIHQQRVSREQAESHQGAPTISLGLEPW